MKLLLNLINKTQEVIDADDIIYMSAVIIPDAENNGPPHWITAIEVLTSHEVITCTAVTFAYGEAIAGRSLSQTKKIMDERN